MTLLNEQDFRLKKLVFAEDDHSVRCFLHELCERRRLGTCAGDASSVSEALKLLLRVRPDLVVFDTRLGGEDGFALVRQAEFANLSAKFIVISEYLDDRAVLMTEGLHLNGSVLRGGPTAADDFEKAVRAAALGERFYCEAHRLHRQIQALDPECLWPDLGIACSIAGSSFIHE